MIPIELVSLEFPKLCGFVTNRRRAVTASNGRRCVSADCINDVFTHIEPQGTRFESMTPSVIWLDFFVRYTERPDPRRKSISRRRRSGRACNGCSDNELSPNSALREEF